MKLRNNQGAPERDQAFSLVEIMVAVGLLAFIIVGLLAMFYQTQRAFRSSSTQTDVLEAGRATVQMIRQDLQDLKAAGHPAVTNFLLLPARNSTPLTFQLPPNKGGGNLVTELMDVNFLQKINDEWVGIAYRIEGADTGVGTLRRMEERRSLDTLDPFTDTQTPTPEGLITLSSYWNSLPASDPGLHRVIDGVVHFAIYPYDTNGVPLALTNIYTGNLIPAYVDLELGILEPKTLVQFNARTNDMVKAQNYLLDRVERIHLFKQRIPIRSRP